MTIKQKGKHIFQLVTFVLLYIAQVMQKSWTVRRNIKICDYIASQDS
jgi:hypothetical protein